MGVLEEAILSRGKRFGASSPPAQVGARLAAHKMEPSKDEEVSEASKPSPEASKVEGTEAKAADKDALESVFVQLSLAGGGKAVDDDPV